MALVLNPVPSVRGCPKTIGLSNDDVPEDRRTFLKCLLQIRGFCGARKSSWISIDDVTSGERAWAHNLSEERDVRSGRRNAIELLEINYCKYCECTFTSDRGKGMNHKLLDSLTATV